jgi:hypothetical protein
MIPQALPQAFEWELHPCVELYWKGHELTEVPSSRYRDIVALQGKQSMTRSSQAPNLSE